MAATPGHPYPPKRFHDLDAGERSRWLEISQDLAQAIRNTRGHPLLSAWEEGFLRSIAQLLERSHGHIGISEKQWQTIERIVDRLADADEGDYPETAD